MKLKIVPGVRKVLRETERLELGFGQSSWKGEKRSPEPLSPSCGSERSYTDMLTRSVTETQSDASSSVKLAASRGRNVL